MYHEFVFDEAPFAACHASTLVELPDRSLIAAWFGGTHEKHPDVAIWLARRAHGRWSAPVRVADEPGVPLWNPVLFLDSADTLWLFYKIAPEIPAWTGVYCTSRDYGQSWSHPTPLAAGLLGPIKNKPIVMSNGEIICGSSTETWRAWACWVEVSGDGGRSWRKYGPIVAPPAGEVPAGAWDGAEHAAGLPANVRGVIQPAIWEHAPGRLKMLMRATRAVGEVCAAESDDYGRSWSAAYGTGIAHSNTGIDAVRLRDGRVVLACTPARDGRTPLALLVSHDNGTSWPGRVDLETAAGEYSYPALIEGRDGAIHLTYTYRRERIKYWAIAASELP